MNLLWRVAFLLALMSVVAWIDRRRNRSRATKWREYGFLVFGGLLGGLFGIAIDHLTATISPDYFVLGKGIAADDNFRLSVTGLGFQAGMAAGVVIGGCYLIANNPKPLLRLLPYPGLVRFSLRPAVCALLFAPVVSVMIEHWDPFDFRARMADCLSQPQLTRFLAVWGIHIGLYVGALVGTILGVAGIRRARSAAAERPI